MHCFQQERRTLGTVGSQKKKERLTLGTVGAVSVYEEEDTCHMMRRIQERLTLGTVGEHILKHRLLVVVNLLGEDSEEEEDTCHMRKIHLVNLLGEDSADSLFSL